MKKFNDLKEVIENIKIGDNVSFNKKNSFFRVSGEIIDFYLLNKKFHITIFSYFNRRNKTYILTNELELIKPGRKLYYNNEAFIYDDIKEKKSLPFFLKRILVKSLSILLIVSFFLLYYPHAFFLLFSPSLKYEKFLSNDYSINELYHTVTSRLIYQSDIAGDFWDTPEFAWEKQSGDCEEFASICADYLTHHKIENYLVGLQTRDPNIGHAVVFLKLKNIYYIIDPTDALESTGVRKINNCSSLRDAVMKYSILPCEVYKIPSYENEKKIISYIY